MQLNVECIVLDDSFDDEQAPRVPKPKEIIVCPPKPLINIPDTERSRKRPWPTVPYDPDVIDSFKFLTSPFKPPGCSEMSIPMGRVDFSTSTSVNALNSLLQQAPEFQQASVDVYKDRIAKNCSVTIELLKSFITKSDFCTEYISFKPERLKYWQPVDVSKELWEVLRIPEVRSLFFKK